MRRPYISWKTVFIEDIADAWEAVMDGWNQFLNSETGEIVFLPDADNCWIDRDDEDKELAEEIEYSNNYVRLPISYYGRFCLCDS